MPRILFEECKSEDIVVEKILDTLDWFRIAGNTEIELRDYEYLLFPWRTSIEGTIFKS